ncbi:MAG: putative baseplate assembly protein [Anaerolineae bacterium]|nr:putative baseplate assembly protein [Anaerolineae bacterium]
MRVRLLSGGYGYRNCVKFDGNEVSYVVPQPPALGRFLLGYTWQYGPFHPEHVLAYNDFQYVDRTEAAKWEGESFEPFRLSTDPTPGLYLGFDRDLPVDRLGIYFDIHEERGETQGPVLTWEYWDGFGWEDLVVDDETRNFRVPGLASFIAPDDAQSLARFGISLYWLRARLKEDGPPGAPALQAIYPNAAWAVQHETIVDEPLGASTGRPNQIFQFRRVPVLEGEVVEVRELAGLRANVEWRLVARDVLGSDGLGLKRVEVWLGSEGRASEFVEGDLRLVRDRLKRVVEVWVRWHAQRHLFFSGPGDRDYVLERATGRLFFGDGQQGRIVPEGARLVARLYRTGGGRVGNVETRKISQLLSPASAVQVLFNPVPAQGGAEGETMQTLARRGPASLAHCGRGISPRDLETMAREASASVAVARAVPTRGVGGQVAPGWVTLIIIPHSSDSRPWPSFELREQVRRYIATRGPADVTAAGSLYVTGPAYRPVDVHTTVVPVDPSTAGAVERAAHAALMAFLHPLTGGPGGQGWEAGRAVYLSDVAAELERVPGLDFVKELALLVDGRLYGESVPIEPDRIVVAGDIRIKVLQGKEGACR